MNHFRNGLLHCQFFRTVRNVKCAASRERFDCSVSFQSKQWKCGFGTHGGGRTSLSANSCLMLCSFSKSHIFNIKLSFEKYTDEGGFLFSSKTQKKQVKMCFYTFFLNKKNKFVAKQRNSCQLGGKSRKVYIVIHVVLNAVENKHPTPNKRKLIWRRKQGALQIRYWRTCQGLFSLASCPPGFLLSPPPQPECVRSRGSPEKVEQFRAPVGCGTNTKRKHCAGSLFTDCASLPPFRPEAIKPLLCWVKS